ncbi:MAG: glycosyltransferase family A protein [Terriglobales bacterium]
MAHPDGTRSTMKLFDDSKGDESVPVSCEPAAQNQYVLVTAAHNEEAFIERTIQAVCAQEMRPRKWVIVDDGSTDDTAKIVGHYAEKYSFIHLLQLSKLHAPDFGAQVHAINAGVDWLQKSGVEFDCIGNVDSDISFDGLYFRKLISKFEADPTLGLAGGWLYEEDGASFTPRKGNRVKSVPHGIQLFRRACFQAIGGYIPLRYGAPDWCAEISARMNGWKVESFPDVQAFHHRPTGSVSGGVRYLYRAGLAAFALGSHPAFEMAKCVVSLHRRPYVVGALSRLSGFAAGYWRREKRQVSNELVRFLRREQTLTLVAGLLGPLGLAPRGNAAGRKASFSQ